MKKHIFVKYRYRKRLMSQLYYVYKNVVSVCVLSKLVWNSNYYKVSRTNNFLLGYVSFSGNVSFSIDTLNLDIPWNVSHMKSKCTTNFIKVFSLVIWAISYFPQEMQPQNPCVLLRLSSQHLFCSKYSLFTYWVKAGKTLIFFIISKF